MEFTTPETFGWEFTVLQRVFKSFVSVTKEEYTLAWLKGYVKVEGTCDFSKFVVVRVRDGNKIFCGEGYIFPKIADGVDNSVLED